MLVLWCTRHSLSLPQHKAGALTVDNKSYRKFSITWHQQQIMFRRAMIQLEQWFVCFKHIHSDHFYSTSSSPLLLRSAPDTARILCRSFTPKCHRQLWVKDLPKVPTWRLERESNPRTSGWKLSTQPMRHHVPTNASYASRKETLSFLCPNIERRR